MLASGNVVFEADETDPAALVERLKAALSQAFGFHVALVLRDSDELRRLVAANPLAEIGVTPQTRPHVTFLKREPVTKPDLPRRVPDKGYEILGIVEGAVCSVVDLSGATTP